MKLNNLKIAPKLGISLFGLCVAGALALYLVREEMFNAAIEEQGAATREIARNIQPVAAGSNEINSHIGGVTTAAAATGTAAGDVLSNARELDNNQSGMLHSAVDGFLAKVRTA